MLSFFSAAIRRGAVAFVLLFGCFVLQGASSDPASYLHGIDVSRYQREVNWQHVKESNIAFAFIKATEGDFLKDAYFDRNWEHSQQNGIKRGAYHFYLPWVDVEKQLALFKNTVTLQPGDLAPVLDIETFDREVSDAQLRRDVQRWLTGVEEHYGVKPIIYTNQVFYNQKLRGYFKGYHFWIARYQDAEPYTHQNDKMAFWQYSEKGKVRGIDYPVDVNWFYGDLNALNNLCLPTPVLPAPAPTEVVAQTNPQ